ncbi:hypothetical protein [Tomitella gaofuii]|uniref:hypothetical protein n=1 Tax=Tomitella gaofuii TaxID=2760083 RepID=UPI0015FB7B16|nr:hypothetical protein [Tomitella gaofuii]
MHAVLDVMEHIAKDNREEKDVAKINTQLYRPDPRTMAATTVDESDTSFDEFMGYAEGWK